LLGAGAVACATILDLPERAADPGDGGGVGASAGTDAASGGGGSGGGAGSGATSGSGGVPAGGGSAGALEDGSPPDAELDGDAGDAPWAADATTPGMIECGSELCTAGSDQACCASPTTGLAACGLTSQCAKPSLKIMCDEVTDCLTGTVCCAELLDGGGLVFSASCRNACAGPGTPVQLCSSTAECKQGECLWRTCKSGVQIQACSSTSACP
jgi:hypothetical protein